MPSFTMLLIDGIRELLVQGCQNHLSLRAITDQMLLSGARENTFDMRRCTPRVYGLEFLSHSHLTFLSKATYI